MTAPAWLQAFWDQLQPQVVQGALAILAALVGLALTWIRRQQLKWETAKQATEEAEAFGAEHDLDGQAKLTIALRRVRNSAPLLAKMGPEESKRMIHKALRESAPGVPIGDVPVSRTAPTLPPKE